MSKLWEHYFVGGGEYEDICFICGGALRDVAGGSIGCEAGVEGNPPSYVGFVLTPFEYGLGYTSVEKAEHLMAAAANAGHNDSASWSQAVATWNAKIRRELVERGAIIDQADDASKS